MRSQIMPLTLAVEFEGSPMSVEICGGGRVIVDSGSMLLGSVGGEEREAGEVADGWWWWRRRIGRGRWVVGDLGEGSFLAILKDELRSSSSCCCCWRRNKRKRSS